MNPQEPNGNVSPQLPNVVQIPGQGPLPVTPIQPVNPQQQPAVEHSPYEFIINPEQRPKPAGPLAGGSTIKRALIFGGGLVVLLILFAVVSSAIGGGGDKLTPLLTVAQEQTELIRVATAGTTTSTTETTQAFAYSVQLSITGANQKLITYTDKNVGKLNPALLGLKHSTTADTDLQNAQANSTYDTTLVDILQGDLNDYSLALKAAYKADPGPNGEKLLSSQYDAAQLLIQQSKQQ